jgi:hypothetical protein
MKNTKYARGWAIGSDNENQIITAAEKVVRDSLNYFIGTLDVHIGFGNMCDKKRSPQIHITSDYETIATFSLAGMLKETVDDFLAGDVYLDSDAYKAQMIKLLKTQLKRLEK